MLTTKAHLEAELQLAQQKNEQLAAELAGIQVQLNQQIHENAQQRELIQQVFHKKETILVGQRKIFESIAKGSPLSDLLAMVSHLIELVSEEQIIASTMLVDKTGQHLYTGAAPSLPEGYNRAIDGIKIGPESGSCGTAAYKKERVIVADIANDPLWQDYKDLALNYGLKSCWSTPIISISGKVLGTFAIYSREPHLPYDHDLELINIIAQTAAIVIESKYAEEKRNNLLLREKEARAEAELAKQQIVAILESMADSFIALDKEWHIAYLNRNAEILLEELLSRLQPEARTTLLGRNIWHIFPELINTEVYTYYQKAISEQVVVEYEYFYPSISAWFEIRAYPSDTGLSIFFRDITSRKQEEIERTQMLIREQRIRREMEAVHRTIQIIADNATAGLFMTDAEGRCTYVNSAGEKITQYSEQELKGQILHNLIHYTYPNGRAYPISECPIEQALLNNHQLKEHIDIFVRKDGSFFPVACAVSPIIKDNVPIGTVIEVRDTSAEQIAESELARLAAIVESSPNPIISHTVEGIILSWNPSAERLYGYSNEEIQHRHLSLLFPTEYKEDLSRNIMLPLNRGEQINNLETAHITKDRRLINVSLTISPVRNKLGTIISASTIVRDMTERKYIERERLKLLSPK